MLHSLLKNHVDMDPFTNFDVEATVTPRVLTVIQYLDDPIAFHFEDDEPLGGIRHVQAKPDVTHRRSPSRILL